MELEDLSPEMQEKAKACKSIEELEKLAESLGVKLSDKALASVAGGTQPEICRRDRPCPNFMVPKPCSEKDHCAIFSCATLYCTELPCTVFGPCEELAPCPEDLGPIPVPGPESFKA